MPRFPWVLYAATAIQALPLLVGLTNRRAVSAARGWILGWCALQVAADLASKWAADQYGSNLLVYYISTPARDAVLLWGLSNFQRHPIARLTFRTTIPFEVVTWAGLVILLERTTQSFSLSAAPFHAILMLAAALFTLLSRSAAEHQRATRQDWFWIGLGLSVYFAAGTALQPFARALIADRPDLVRMAFVTKAWIDVLAFILIAFGMACPRPRTKFGGSSWLDPSPSS